MVERTRGDLLSADVEALVNTISDPGYFKIAQDRIAAAQAEREGMLIPA